MIWSKTILICFLYNLMSPDVVFGYTVDCKNLRIGQYLCIDIKIDPVTQSHVGCTKDRKTKINCTAADGIICTQTGTNIFEKEIDCEWTNGYSFEIALLLSIFLGMFGADRFYLGYPALGLLKFCSFGFLFVGQFIDVILIATQVVGPSDGSSYVMNYYGPKLRIVKRNNETLRNPQQDWL